MKVRLWALMMVAALTAPLCACTGILLNSTDNSIVTGRTVEFASPLQFNLAVVPRNYRFVSQTPLGNGMAYTSKYAVAGIYCFNNKSIMDGINEAGLTAAIFFFPGYAGYAPTNAQNQKTSLSPVDFVNWILTQFGSINEVLSAVKSVSVAPTVVQGWGSSPPPFHFIVYDSTGRSIVIEPINGQLVVYKNLVGSFTNSPTFDWHVTNLTNYINLSTYNAPPVTVRGLTLTSYGQGSGLNGLPGDFSSVSRFVRASLYSTASIPVSNASLLPNEAFHILNQFDIPYGAVRQKSQGSTQYDYTQLTTVKDPNTLRYYFKSYANQTVQYIDLNQFNLNANQIVSQPIQGSQTNVNISSQLK